MAAARRGLIASGRFTQRSVQGFAIMGEARQKLGAGLDKEQVRVLDTVGSSTTRVIKHLRQQKGD
jgi:hypothetical protein